MTTVGGQIQLWRPPNASVSGKVPELRAYQSKMIEDCRERMRQGCQRVVLCLPTGGGKTTIAAKMIELARDKGKRSLFLAHRRELIQQASARLDAFGLDHGVIMADHWRKAPWLPIQVASVQTYLKRRAFAAENRFDFVFVDECHRTISPSYLEVLGRCGAPCVVGLSATPYRADGRGLGEYFDGLVMGPSIESLTQDGFLVPVTIYAPPIDAMAGAKVLGGDYKGDELEQRMNRKTLIGDLVEHWKQLAQGRPTVAFAVSVEHSKNIAKAFEEAGVRAAHLDGETPEDVRDQLLAKLSAGEIEVISNCAVLTEGWDCPPVSCGIIARPTLSKSLWRQMAGRILRTAPGKPDAILLDHGGCSHQHGHVYESDLIDLGSKKIAKKASAAASPAISICKTCFGVFPRASASTCPYCGAIRERQGAEPKIQAGQLQPLLPGQAPAAESTKRPRVRLTLEECRRRAELFQLEAQTKGYKPGWVYYKLVGIFGEQLVRQVLTRSPKA